MFFVNQVHFINIRSEERKGLFQKRRVRSTYVEVKEIKHRVILRNRNVFVQQYLNFDGQLYK